MALLDNPYRLQPITTSLLPHRVRALSVPVSPCVVQRDRCFHPAHVFLTGSSATDGSLCRLRRVSKKMPRFTADASMAC